MTGENMPIRQLKPETVNRIAAGEVVERPASVVKELVENALDAGATDIEVVTAAGGISLIRVTDNGAGMSASDLALAVERHATSKLADDDLFNIATLGFRGEALPSIGSIAHLAIASRLRGAASAHEIVVDRGVKEGVRPAALNPGTRVEVRELFSATPARLKFLKSERAENLGISEVVKRLAMAHPRSPSPSPPASVPASSCRRSRWAARGTSPDSAASWAGSSWRTRCPWTSSATGCA